MIAQTQLEIKDIFENCQRFFIMVPKIQTTVEKKSVNMV